MFWIGFIAGMAMGFNLATILMIYLLNKYKTE